MLQCNIQGSMLVYFFKAVFYDRKIIFLGVSDILSRKASEHLHLPPLGLYYKTTHGGNLF
jgi:hypothetical protein